MLFHFVCNRIKAIWSQGVHKMLTFSKSVALGLSRRMSHTTRWFNGGFVHAKQLPPRPTIEETDLEESFLKGSGPGGQKIVNCSNSVSDAIADMDTLRRTKLLQLSSSNTYRQVLSSKVRPPAPGVKTAALRGNYLQKS